MLPNRILFCSTMGQSSCDLKFPCRTANNATATQIITIIDLSERTRAKLNRLNRVFSWFVVSGRITPIKTHETGYP